MSPEGNNHNFIPPPKRTKFYFLIGFNFLNQDSANDEDHFNSLSRLIVG